MQRIILSAAMLALAACSTTTERARKPAGLGTPAIMAPMASMAQATITSVTGLGACEFGDPIGGIP